MTWRNYQMSCGHLFRWNTSFAVLPNCTDKCKQSAEKLGMDRIGRQLKCCRCGGDRKCNRERINVGLFCGINLNNAKECQNDRIICNSTTRDMGGDEMKELRETQQDRGEQNEREREDQNEECNREDQAPENTFHGKEQKYEFDKTCYAM